LYHTVSCGINELGEMRILYITVTVNRKFNNRERSPNS